MKHATIILLLLAAAGCRMDQPGNYPATPDSSWSNYTAIPNSSAAKVAAVMSANDITVAQIAAYLYPLGWTIDQLEVPDPRWTRPVTGGPVSYYVGEMRFAVADTHVAHRFRNIASGPYALRVRAVGSGLAGPWSEWSWSDNGDGSNALPGIVE